MFPLIIFELFSIPPLIWSSETTTKIIMIEGQSDQQGLHFDGQQKNVKTRIDTHIGEHFPTNLVNCGTTICLPLCLYFWQLQRNVLVSQEFCPFCHRSYRTDAVVPPPPLSAWQTRQTSP